MKKLVAFALVLSLGLFCAVGCGKAAAPAKKDAPKAGAAAGDVKKDAPKAGGAAAPDVKKEEPKKDEPKK
jgi:hypothetical protein